MVSWSGDGLVSGYDPTTKKHKAGVFHLASPGSVDTNGGTRLHWDLVSGYPNKSSYPTRLDISATMTFTSGDFTAHPSRDKGMAAVMVNAARFADGVVPTPSQIFNEYVAASDAGSHYIGGAASLPATMQFVNAELEPNTKYWLLVYPADIVDVNQPWSKINYEPLGNINTNGRAISVWTNRTPAAPTITSPPTGSVVESGNTFTLAYTPNDPDKLTPNDSLRSNHDLAGVEVEYAPIPTVSNPSPTWRSLGYWDAAGEFDFADVAVGQTGASNKIDILRNLGFPVICGVEGDEIPPAHGVLAAGDWQIRVRVADFGHAWPNIVNPLGVTPGRKVANFPSANLSPWSEPVLVTVPSQVPPPIPLSPTDSTATQEGDTVRLSWQYRNTFDPPLDQTARWVQIRKVGDPEWSTVFAGVSGNAYVDLTPTIENPDPTPDAEYMTDLGFEGGTLDGWIGKSFTDFGAGDLDPPSSTGITLSNVNNASLSHTGNRHLSMANTGAEHKWPIFVHTADIADPLHNVFRLSLYFRPPDTADDPDGSAQIAFAFLDEDGAIVQPVGGETTFVTVTIPTPDTGWGWIEFEVPELVVPPTAVKTLIYAFATALLPDDSDFKLLSGHRLDDVSLIGGNLFNTDDFTLVATTHYEWRVRVRDEDGVLSNYSEPARFWVVPAVASGEVRPIPADTTDGATLGCGTHKVFVFRRGGLERVGEIRGLTHVDWSRIRDDISTSKVIIEDWDLDCGNLLARLQTWAYELVIFRDNGYSVERVWEGPITLLTYEQDRVIIQAKDVMGYAYRRILKQRMSDAGTGNGRTVVARAKQVLQNALAPDDPNVLAYLQVLTQADDALQYRSTPAYSRTAFEEVDDMAANSGLDYTTVGRAILLWGTRHRIGTLPEFRDENLGAAPIVSEYGMSMANLYSVSDGNGVHGEADRLDVSGNDEIYGLVEMLSSTWASDSTEDTGTYTQEGLETVRQSFEEFSERSIADRYPPPVVVRVPDNTTINPDTVLSIQQLVPGVVIPLRSSGTLRSVVGNQKLDSVRVVEEGGSEVISITLSPFNRDDAALTEEGGEE